MRISDWSSDVCSSDLDDQLLSPVTERLDDDVERAMVHLRQFGARADQAAVKDDIGGIALVEPVRGADLVPRRVEAVDRLAHHLARQLSGRSEEHTSELQSLMRHSYAVFCLKNKKNHKHREPNTQHY